jgi:pyridoxal phosphate enzyme (YggS family)
MKDTDAAISGIRQRIAAAAARAGRDHSAVRLVAVSKTHPPGAVTTVAATGQRIFGESRVQEAREKIPLCSPGLDWHFIGHLQRNKIRQALPLFSLFHSIDSPELAAAIDRIAAETGSTVRGLAEVNITGEPTKHGFSPEALRTLLRPLLGLAHLRLEGLMTMAPWSDNPEDARPVFRALRELRDELAAGHGAHLPELSMGMSGDFEPAVEEGATLVRVGTSIFGSRPRQAPAP